MDYRLLHGDCLEIMPGLAAGSVDAIITDLPYGTTQCSWDVVLPFVDMWRAVRHVLKPRGIFVTTSNQPFTSLLICSNLDWFRYEWIWRKSLASGFLNAKNAPLRGHENILVFSGGSVAHETRSNNRMTYNPQMERGTAYRKFNRVENKHKWDAIGKPSGPDYMNENKGTRMPVSVLEFANPNHNNEHPTQKPIELFEYLVMTYSNPGDVILDLTMGSGTTGVACMMAGRSFIGIEKNKEYFEIAQKRISQAANQPILLAVEPGYKPSEDNQGALI